VNPVAGLYRSAAIAMRPDPERTVSSWADEYRVLTSKESPEPGPWRTDRVPHLREIMDCLSPSHPAHTVVFVKAAQIGATEAGLNWIGYVVDQTPGPMLVVQPTTMVGTRYSRQRVAPLIENAKDGILRRKIVAPRSKDGGNTLDLKEFPGGVLIIGGANSAATLRSMPICYLHLDEIDGYPEDVDGEGDPVALAEERTERFRRRKIYKSSTPTTEGLSRISEEYDASDRRRWYVPCHHCTHWQPLTWSQVHWDSGNAASAVYVCRDCGSPWSDGERYRNITHGEWRAERAFEGIAGFHAPAMVSLMAPLEKIVRKWLRAQKRPEKLKSFVNLSLGETWKEKALSIDKTGLLERRENYEAEPLPHGVVVITAGVDVQDDRFELEIVGWGRDEETWSIDYRVLNGDPSAPALWKDLDTELRGTFAHPAGIQLPIRATCIDSGGHHTQAVYKFCKERWGRKVWATKGMGGPGRLIMGKPSRNNKAKVPLFPLGVDTAKALVYARLQLQEHGTGYCHFPDRYDEDYFAQLTSEKVVTRYTRGFPTRIWVKPDGVRNEALDCRVLALGAFVGLAPKLNRLCAEMEERLKTIEVEEDDPDEPEAPNTVPQQARSRRTSRPSSWVNRW